jgi:hypothetical protein
LKTLAHGPFLPVAPLSRQNFQSGTTGDAVLTSRASSQKNGRGNFQSYHYATGKILSSLKKLFIVRPLWAQQLHTHESIEVRLA